MNVLTTATEAVPAPRSAPRRLSSAWINSKLVAGIILLAAIILLGVVGSPLLEP